MVVLLASRHGKDDLNIGIKSFELVLLVVDGGLEVDAINTRM
jgi:hypothetical protein